MFFIALLLFILVSPVLADEEATVDLAYYSIDNIMLFICAVLVLFMQAGFAMLESGLTPYKNTVNVMFKNIFDLSVGIILFYIFGYSLMYGTDISGVGLLAWKGFGISETLDVAELGPGVLHPQVDWLFQVAFAAAAATIISGAVMGRIHFKAYLICSAVITCLIYPISGFWKWGGGWLDQLGFYDFAGSVVVHSVGGFAALAGAIVLGPRIGRFNKDGSVNEIPGHSLAQSTLGVLVLWIGWYGFNGGSQLAFSGSANIEATMLIAANTTLAAAAGALASLAYAWRFSDTHKPNLSITFNGILAGLVGITANCDSVSNVEAIIIGGIAGILVVLGNRFLLKLRIDDAVGAWPVHGLCGVWGGIATGIFGAHAIGPQIIGSLVIPIWAFGTMFILFFVLKKLNRLRVSEEEERQGLDIIEHGQTES
jgi:Amt family ammonium transporter